MLFTHPRSWLRCRGHRLKYTEWRLRKITVGTTLTQSSALCSYSPSRARALCGMGDYNLGPWPTSTHMRYASTESRECCESGVAAERSAKSSTLQHRMRGGRGCAHSGVHTSYFRLHTCTCTCTCTCIHVVGKGRWSHLPLMLYMYMYMYTCCREGKGRPPLNVGWVDQARLRSNKLYRQLYTRLYTTQATERVHCAPVDTVYGN